VQSAGLHLIRGGPPFAGDQVNLPAGVGKFDRLGRGSGLPDSDVGQAMNRRGDVANDTLLYTRFFPGRGVF
jgi:hypothetical protein